MSLRAHGALFDGAAAWGKAAKASLCVHGFALLMILDLEVGGSWLVFAIVYGAAALAAGLAAGQGAGPPTAIAAGALIPAAMAATEAYWSLDMSSPNAPVRTLLAAAGLAGTVPIAVAQTVMLCAVSVFTWAAVHSGSRRRR